MFSWLGGLGLWGLLLAGVVAWWLWTTFTGSTTA
jgi:hypothetical protein